MRSAGNDIVALDKIDTGRSQHPGFYTKILAGAENALYQDDLFPLLSFEHFLWLLWSIKESVYKYAKRTCPGLVFSPTKIVVESIATSEDETGLFYAAQVRAGSGVFHTRSFITADCIFSMANHTNDFSEVTWGLHPIDNDGHEFQSRAVRVFLLQRLTTLFPDVYWEIEKSPEGYPILLRDRQPCHHIPVSFAHHGHFVGYSLAL